ncbi:alpha/beta fold hydrolase [Polaribacter sp.]|nr:alpha/beta fold hydrolase [Polaribacter sp.]
MKILKNFVIQGKHQKPIVTDVFYNETQQSQKVIIFCHGYKGFKDWGAWNLMAERLANAGYFFIKFNFSHNGGTLEQPIDFPDLEAFGNNNYTKELDDLQSVLDWISNNSQFKNTVDSNQISIIGHSRGGGIVTLKAAQDPRVKNIISLASVCDFASRSSTNSDLSAWKKTGVKYVLNGRTKQQMPHFYQFHEDFVQNKERLNIQRAAKKITIPHLIIHGDKDSSISATEAEKLHVWNPKSVLKIIENANHVFNVSHPWTEKKGSEAFEKTIKICIDFLSQ